MLIRMSIQAFRLMYNEDDDEYDGDSKYLYSFDKNTYQMLR